jgi:hypothetical protein
MLIEGHRIDAGYLGDAENSGFDEPSRGHISIAGSEWEAWSPRSCGSTDRHLVVAFQIGFHCSKRDTTLVRRPNILNRTMQKMNPVPVFFVKCIE